MPPSASTSPQQTDHATRLARIRAERAALGRSPFIESPSIYALIAAVVDAAQQSTKS
jgi:hypothetical protein